jgi:hypothetical protein
MKEETIKDILSKDLKKISKEDFNEKIIQQLNLSRKKEKLILYDQRSIIKIFLIISLFILVINLKIIEELQQTSIIIGLLICISPLFFMVFNKIYHIIHIFRFYNCKCN